VAQVLLPGDEAALVRAVTEAETEAVVIVDGVADVEDEVLQRMRRKNGNQSPSLVVLSRQER